MLIDVHCHLDHHFYKDILDDVIKRAKATGIKKIVTSGIDNYTNKIALEISKKYDIVEVSFGRYPEDALDREGYYENNPNAKPLSLEEDINFFRENKNNFIAIGEIGIDLFNGRDLELQKRTFRAMIELAVELNKPIIVHTRKAEKESLDILEEYLENSEININKKKENSSFKLPKNKTLNPKKVILHCFSGKKKLIERGIQNKFNFSIPANIAKNFQFQYIVEKASLKQILTETDGPYLSPFKNEDGSFNLNEPSNVKETIKEISKIKKITEEECVKQIFMNYQMTF
jgi:TatD DNase family protein